jgi:hypothetical protein
MPSRAPLAAALLLAAGAAPAATRVAVVTLSAPPQLAVTGRSVAEAFATRAAASGYEVVGPAAVEARLGPAAHAALVACGDDSICLAERGAALGVDRIVGGTLSKRYASYRVALVSADARTGERLGGLEREIAIASRRVQKDVADAAPALLQGAQEPTGVLKVTTDVPGAKVMVDGAPAGFTPVARVLKPGRHEVRVALPGYADAEPAWVDVPANGIVEHRPRLHAVPARERPDALPAEEAGPR